MVKHCKTNVTNKRFHSSFCSPMHQLLLSFPSQQKWEDGPVIPSCSELQWGTGGCRMLLVRVGKGSNPSCQLIWDPPQPENTPSHARAQPQTPARWPWVHQRCQPSLAQGRYSAYEFPLNLKDLYENKVRFLQMQFICS